MLDEQARDRLMEDCNTLSHKYGIPVLFIVGITKGNAVVFCSALPDDLTEDEEHECIEVLKETADKFDKQITLRYAVAKGQVH